MRLNLPAAIFSINSFAAAMLALFIGFSLDLSRPYWAMLTVYITVQPLSGALRSKAIYRVIGTVLGGVAAVGLVPNLVDQPIALSLALAFWVGFCLYVSLLDRTPRSYVFLLAGYTAAIIGFPSVEAPETIFDTALSRVEEITLGILCASFVHTIFFPRSVLDALNGRVAAMMRDVQNWVGETWGSDISNQERRMASEEERRKLAADITELHILATHLPFDTAAVVPAARTIRALRDRLSLILPLSSAVEDRRRGLVAAGALSADLVELLNRVRTWVAGGVICPRQEAVALQRTCLAAEPDITPESPWTDLLKASLVGRLAELVDAMQDARELASHIKSPQAALPPPLTERLAGAIRRPLHRDPGLAVFSAFPVFMAIIGGCAVWIAIAWPAGAFAPVGAAIFGSFFAAQDNPVPFIRGFLYLTIVSFPITAAYQFAILPAVDGFVMLALVLAPLFLLLGYLQGQPKTMALALPLILGVTNLLAVQAVFAADFAAFANTFIALIGGTAAALIATQLFRSVSAYWSARRILVYGWRDLAANANVAAEKAPDRMIWTSRMLDRVGLLAPRLALIERREQLAGADPLNDLRIGVNVIDLQHARGVVGAIGDRSLERVLKGVADYFRKLSIGRATPVSARLMVEIDRAISDVAHAAPSEERRICLWSLAGLRRNLLPDAPAYIPESQPEAAA
jgi:uncharacterized membrane protein YccC